MPLVSDTCSPPCPIVAEGTAVDHATKGPGAVPVYVRLEAATGRWKRVPFSNASGEVHFRGCLWFDGQELTGNAAASKLWTLLADGDLLDNTLIGHLAKLTGHFAFVLVTPRRTIASVDRIRSHALHYSSDGQSVTIADRGNLFGSETAIDPDQALAVAMSGYTIGAGTLWQGITGLRAGEAVVIDHSIRSVRWHLYDSWNATSCGVDAESALSRLNEAVIDRLIKAAAGRTIAVPLSAGMDSRFIASGLKAAGYDSVLLFSYGQAGNHEATTAELIARRLGYPWRFVAFTPSMQRRLYTDASYLAAIWHDGDCLTSVPFQQDWLAIAELKSAGWLPPDALIVNGQSGDFISGNHAPAALIDAGAGELEQKTDLVINLSLKKHYRLWTSLASPVNDCRIGALLRKQIGEAGANGIGEPAGLAEFLEYQDRQSKYVVSGQKTYEALGFDWRLPLWDDEYIAFWQRLPMHLKRGQSLYRSVLEKDNWANVWQDDIPVNRKTIRPRWLLPLRLLAKAAHAPLGSERWHRFERQVFGWWMDPLFTAAVVPYWTVARDRRGARHSVSWIAERYLRRHGIIIRDTQVIFDRLGGT